MVYISDFAILSSIGNSKDEFWQRLSIGDSGVKSIADRLPVDYSIKQAATVDYPIDFPDLAEMRFGKEVEMNFKYLLNQIDDGNFANVGIDAVVWASGQYGRKITDLIPRNDTYEPFFSTRDFDHAVKSELDKRQLLLKDEFGIINQSNACVTGITAIESAFKRIEAGIWNRALVFIHEARCRDWVLSPYLNMGLLSRTIENGVVISSPFSLDRSGFVKGEGAVLFLLESDSALAERKKAPLATVLGCAQASDGKHIIKMSQDRGSAFTVLDKLLSTSKVRLDSIDYINGYGSASQLNDYLETKLYKGFFGNRAYEIPISTGKPQFGHLNTAAAAIEIASAVLMMKNNFICPTINLRNQDPMCDLDYVPNSGRHRKITTVLKTAFGFGWSNAGILLRTIS